MRGLIEFIIGNRSAVSIRFVILNMLNGVMNKEKGEGEDDC